MVFFDQVIRKASNEVTDEQQTSEYHIGVWGQEESREETQHRCKVIEVYLRNILWDKVGTQGQGGGQHHGPWRKRVRIFVPSVVISR